MRNLTFTTTTTLRSDPLEEARPFIRSVARGYLSRGDDLEDAVQESVLRAYLYREQLHCPGAFRSWLREITRTVCLNMVRRERGRRAFVPEGFDLDDWCPGARTDAGPVVDAVLDNAAVDAVERLVECLPARYGDPLQLVLCRGLSYQAAADQLGLPLGTVKVRLHRAKKLLLAGSTGASIRTLLEDQAA